MILNALSKNTGVGVPDITERMIHFLAAERQFDRVLSTDPEEPYYGKDARRVVAALRVLSPQDVEAVSKLARVLVENGTDAAVLRKIAREIPVGKHKSGPKPTWLANALQDSQS
jgi:hypothetical protein